jgi:hypothetical protein
VLIMSPAKALLHSASDANARIALLMVSGSDRSTALPNDECVLSCELKAVNVRVRMDSDARGHADRVLTVKEENESKRSLIC